MILVFQDLTDFRWASDPIKSKRLQKIFSTWYFYLTC
uniref:Uncharacterized protein n=1 Tax=Arundo donax TaxID=35708 RepID=A0A0A9EA05_ARUDO